MLFSQGRTVGTFKGFSERGLEFAADIVARYDASMLEHPQLGQFLLIELGSTEEAALGRITRLLPSGLLAGPEGEDYMNTMQSRAQPVPEDLKQQRLKYRVQVKLLGAVRMMPDGGVLYVPSQRRLPHLGAQVAWPRAEVLKELCTLSRGSTELGNYVLGEFLYCGAGAACEDPIFRALDPKLPVTFDVGNLVARRSVVFARAGYGKSNLIKLLISELYRKTPTTANGSPVGTLIFDADGEYFWPDAVKGRPGLCDVPHLQDHIVLFTDRETANPHYARFKAGPVRLNIRELPAREVVGIMIPAEKQNQQNVNKLKTLKREKWAALVDLLHTRGLEAEDADIGRLLGYVSKNSNGKEKQPTAANAAEIAGARSNMFNIVSTLHDPASTLLRDAVKALRRGSVVVIDISLLSSAAGNRLAGLLLRHIFMNNQEHFTAAHGRAIIPAIAVIEEAQSVLGKNLDESSPFVEWVKEGRKYDLGAILVTQQPGSMAPELLSQADNWFCFHLLSEGDASTLGRYNSHFSDDVLAHLIAEPIPGNCYMWSAPRQPFVLPVRVHSFEALYSGNIQKATSAISPVSTQAQKVHTALSAAEDALPAALIAELNKSKVKWISFGNGLTGVSSAQLYYLIKEAKSPSDTRNVEHLKQPIMEALLGKHNFVLRTAEGTGKECFVADEPTWTRVLGKAPRVSSQAGLEELGLFP